MREKNSKQLVIDADVARASGSRILPHPTAKHCRDFLAMVSSLNYHIVMTAKLSKEWTKHASNFARRWRVSMETSNKVCAISLSDDQVLYAQISSTAKSKKQVEEIEKDFHLLQAALATDQTIVSCDEKIRRLFARASQQVDEIRDIIWVNPDRAKEEPIAWLQNGAPPEPHRRLSA